MPNLFVGDLHAMSSNLEDTKAIISKVKETAIEHSVDRIIFLGDIFHTHSVVRQEVAYLVKSYITDLSSIAKVFLLAGNHDGASPDSVEKNAVRLVFDKLDGITVVDDYENGLVEDKFFMVPFIGDHDQFISVANKHPEKVLVCHQTIDGARYETKTLAPDGIDRELIPQKEVISGHIHTQQIVSSVFYVGTPRAITFGEANQLKCIVIENNGEYTNIPSGHLAKQYWRYDIEEGKPVETFADTWKKGDDVRICIHGTEEFYRETLKSYSHLVGVVKFIPNIRASLGKQINVEASGGVDESLKEYVYKIYDINDEMKGKVWTKLKALVPNLSKTN